MPPRPSHDLAASRPFDDFDVNAVGTLNVLEATRFYAPESVFIHMSTNKVYGTAPNEVPLIELDKRWDYADPAFANGDDRRQFVSTNHSIPCSVRQKLQPTSWFKSTGCTLE